MSNLEIPSSEFKKVWQGLGELSTGYFSKVAKLPVNPKPDPKKVKDFIDTWDFSKAHNAGELVESWFSAFEKWQLHVGHPNYHGVFNPKPSSLGILADCMVSIFNPQLASSESSVLGVMLEEKLLKYMGAKFGFAKEKTEGMFTSGGTEANLMAVLQALQFYYPDYKQKGLKSIPDNLKIYVSKESHHSLLRACVVSGLGMNVLVEVETDTNGRMEGVALKAKIEEDLKSGCRPLMIAATAGTTSGGCFDDLEAAAELSKKYDCWFHVDAAWGGAGIFLKDYAHLFQGTDQADSITLDAHKWLSVPMGCGLYLSSHPGLLRQTFQVDISYYMPKTSEQSPLPQPYAMSLQWSRRLMGLKLYLTLLHVGEEGLEKIFLGQLEVAEYLRSKLKSKGWVIRNKTDFPVVCFDKEGIDCEKIADDLAFKGLAWLTTTKLQAINKKVLRVGIPNFSTQKQDIDKLLSYLEEV